MASFSSSRSSSRSSKSCVRASLWTSPSSWISSWVSNTLNTSSSEKKLPDIIVWDSDADVFDFSRASCSLICFFTSCWFSCKAEYNSTRDASVSLNSRSIASASSSNLANSSFNFSELSNFIMFSGSSKPHCVRSLDVLSMLNPSVSPPARLHLPASFSKYHISSSTSNWRAGCVRCARQPRMRSPEDRRTKVLFRLNPEDPGS
mmetsp:Transcript_24794/g.46937  ORF Transcript_24794/g.46937 Transcript_24794/m.46937 type:complete len:204 (+) Transcript_24794:1063-1674(+)